MSILIKGIDMPISCEKCPLCYDYLYCSIDDSLHMFLYNRHPNCPLVEVPTPHGRLIDADDFTDVCEILADKGGDIRLWEQAEWIAKDIPTILEAEEV